MAIGSASVVRQAWLMAATMPSPTPVAPPSKLRLGLGSGELTGPRKVEKRLAKDDDAAVSLVMEPSLAGGGAFRSVACSRKLIVLSLQYTCIQDSAAKE
uniref:Uncharacterized protein n=1 Tax=Oryza glumipatula TaxID=40148 RepID=A0A0D9YN23_9ORYZ